MNKLNQLTCYIGGGNTGRSDCDIEPGIEVGGFLIPRGYKFSEEDTATSDAFIAALQEGAMADNPRERFYPVGRYEAINPTGENQVDETGGYGHKRKVRQGTIQSDFTIWAGKGYRASLSDFDNRQSQYDYIEVDANNVVWGVSKKDEAGNAVFAGYRLSSLYVGNYMKSTGSAGGQFMFTVGYEDPNESNKMFAFVQLDADPLDEVKGLQSVYLAATSSSATSIAVTAKVGKTLDLHDYFTTELAVAGAWTVANATTSATITVASVASNPTGWTLTLAPPSGTGADTDNPGSAGKVTVRMAVPSALAGLTVPVAGYESDIIAVTLG